MLVQKLLLTSSAVFSKFSLTLCMTSLYKTPCRKSVAYRRGGGFKPPPLSPLPKKSEIFPKLLEIEVSSLEAGCIDFKLL
jgi:hypothetical protein